MSTVAMAEASPRSKARMAGVFYLLVFLAGAVSLSIGGKFVVADDAVAAQNILANEASFRAAVVVADLITTVCYVAVTALFYELFKPVNRSLSLAAAFFSLVGCAVGAVSAVFHLAPLTVLGGAKYLAAFNVEQTQALALLLLNLYGQTQSVALALFGGYCCLIGYLVFRSTFLPRILGVLMGIGGLGWLTFLWTPLASYLSTFIFAPGILGEGALTLWLLVVGVNEQRWKERAIAA